MELVKDLLYQAYVRKGKLQQAVMMRQFFIAGDENGDTISVQEEPTVTLPGPES
jgi:hypothetical protein